MADRVQSGAADRVVVADFRMVASAQKKTGLHPKDYVGAGDLVFVLLLTPFFDLRDYLFFLLVGAVGSLLWWSIVTRLGRRPATIPLVGTLGTFLILHVVVELARG